MNDQMTEKSLDTSNQPLLSVENLEVEFRMPRGSVKAVNGVSFTLGRNEVLGVVGESGCGKSVMSRAILGLLPSPPAVVNAARMDFRGRDGTTSDLFKMSGKEYQEIRGGQISMIFQEPMTSLNPLFTIGDQLTEHVFVHEDMSKEAARARALELLTAVGIPSPEVRINDYPHQLSGGMRQRVMIAMSMICRPSIVIADEPTTALDVTIQAQILKLLKRMQDQEQTSVIFISHDLAVISSISDKVIVMYLGRVVEEGTPEVVFGNPQHPYTMALLKSLPRIGTTREEGLEPIAGGLPDPLDQPKGCGFHPRCPQAMDKCRQTVPELRDNGSGNRVACWMHQ